MAVDRALMPFITQGQGMEIDVLPPEDDSIMVELPDGRCARCGWDFNVSKVTAADRAVMATLLGRRGGKSR